jgi:hypothetical protein
MLLIEQGIYPGLHVRTERNLILSGFSHRVIGPPRKEHVHTPARRHNLDGQIMRPGRPKGKWPAPRSGDDADGVCTFDPLAGRQRKDIQPRLFSKPVEFDGIKSRVVQLLPDAKELDRVAGCLVQ